MSGYLIRNAELRPGAPLSDVRVEGGAITEIGARLAGEEGLDARGGALIPGLADHHIHLLATAALDASLDVENVTDTAAFAARVQAHLAQKPDNSWVRVVGYHERIAGVLGREALDALAPRHKLRVQHQSGILWVLNSAALADVLVGDIPDCVERDAQGRPTGRIWRGDAWLRSKTASAPPSLAPLGARLAALGITAVTDASVTTTDVEARLIADASRAGDMPQRLRLMSGGALTPPPDGAFQVGEVKLLLDEASLPDLEAIGAKIAFAREQRRALAVHCVTATELAFALAAFEAFGAPRGSRIEHGSVVPEDAFGAIRALGLSIIAQPGLIYRRGDRFLAETPAEERADLYRCASLLNAGVGIGFSSDAPYGLPDPWQAIAAASQRRTSGGQTLGVSEQIPAGRALGLYFGRLEAPCAARIVGVGEAADLCVLSAPLREALAAPRSENVLGTIVGGAIVYRASAQAPTTIPGSQ